MNTYVITIPNLKETFAVHIFSRSYSLLINVQSNFTTKIYVTSYKITTTETQIFLLSIFMTRESQI